MPRARVSFGHVHGKIHAVFAPVSKALSPDSVAFLIRIRNGKKTQTWKLQRKSLFFKSQCQKECKNPKKKDYRKIKIDKALSNPDSHKRAFILLTSYAFLWKRVRARIYPLPLLVRRRKGSIHTRWKEGILCFAQRHFCNKEDRCVISSSWVFVKRSFFLLSYCAVILVCYLACDLQNESTNENS